MPEIRNAKITETQLGYCEKGILTFGLCLDIAGGSGVLFGNVVLDNYDMIRCERVPGTKAMECITTILKVVGVDTWEQLKGQYIRIEDNDWGSTVDKIGNLMEEKWFSLKEFFGGRNHE